MSNTFLDGTKVAVELCAAANALGYSTDTDGSHMPETDKDGLLKTFRPSEDGGVLDHAGVVDSVTPTDKNLSLRRDGSAERGYAGLPEPAL